WAAKPAMRTGSDTRVAAAQSLPRNRPWLEMKPTRKIGAVEARTAVRLTANMNSFQLKMKQIRLVAASPGAATGATTLHRVRSRPAPSTSAASRISLGTSARNERIIHTAMGRFIEVYRMTKVQMLSSMPAFLTIRYIGRRAAIGGRNLVDRKKNITSVHLTTGLIDRA